MNPYAEEEVELTSVCDLFGNFQPLQKLETRGDFLAYFSQKTGYSIPRVAYKLTGIKDLASLWYIKSCSDKAVLEGRKENYRHAFNSCLFIPAVDN